MNFDQNRRIISEEKSEKHQTASNSKSKNPILFLRKTENREIEEKPQTATDAKTEKATLFGTKAKKKITETENPNTTLHKVKSFSELWCKTFAVKH